MERKKDNLTDIKGAFQNLLKDYKIDSRFTATRIRVSWERIMGHPIASRTKDITLHQGKLRVKITSAPLKNELNMSRSTVLARIEDEFGKGIVDEVIFI